MVYGRLTENSLSRNGHFPLRRFPQSHFPIKTFPWRKCIMISACSCPSPGRMAVTRRRLVPHRPPRWLRAGRGDGLVCCGSIDDDGGAAHFFEDERVSAMWVSDLPPDMVRRPGFPQVLESPWIFIFYFPDLVSPWKQVMSLKVLKFHLWSLWKSLKFRAI